MALYKNGEFLQRSMNEEFDKAYGPGEAVPNSGIYRCQGCADEIAANKGDPFPPQNHHQHSTVQGKIRWQLTVFPQSKR